MHNNTQISLMFGRKSNETALSDILLRLRIKYSSDIDRKKNSDSRNIKQHRHRPMTMSAICTRVR